jgi:hypothetical protein
MFFLGFPKNTIIGDICVQKWYFHNPEKLSKNYIRLCILSSYLIILDLCIVIYFRLEVWVNPTCVEI